MPYNQPKKNDAGRWVGDPTIWINVKEMPSTSPSDMRVAFEIPEGCSLDAGTKWVAFLKWNKEWNKWTGGLKMDTYDSGRAALDRQAPANTPRPSNGLDPNDLPF